jgi:hypothetical protein
MTRLIEWWTGIASRRVTRLIVLVSVTTLVLAPVLFRPGFTAAPDAAMHLFNTQRYANEFEAGRWYVRWLGDWYSGYGAPIGAVYPPLTYYGAGLLTALGLEATTALKITLWISLFASGWFALRLASKFIVPAGGLLVGVLYQILPYRFIDLYIRSAVPEFVAFMWLPLVLWLLVRCARYRRVLDHVGLAVAVAALLLTHFLIAYMFALVLLPFFMYLVWRQEQRRWRTALSIAGAAGLGGLLAATYWLPAFTESAYINTAWLQNLQPGLMPPRQEWANYYNNFLFGANIYQGTSLAGVYRENLLIGVGAVLSFGVIVLAFGINLLDWRQRSAPAREMAVFMVWMGLVSTFMSFSISRPIWALLPRAEITQFPWRWQTIAVLAAAYLAGDTLTWSAQRWHQAVPSLRLGYRLLPWGMIGLTTVNLIFSMFLMWRYHNQMTDDVVQQITGQRPLTPENSAWVFDDLYVPLWGMPLNYTANPVTEATRIVTSGTDSVKIETWSSTLRIFSLVNSVPISTTVNVRTFWFPGWRAEVNGKPASLEVNRRDGTMLLPIPGGSVTAQLIFEDTLPRSIGNLVSVVALIIFGSLMVAGGYRYWRRGKQNVVF